VNLSNADYLKKVKQEGLDKIFPGKPRIAVGFGSCGIAAGATAVFEALQAEIKKKKTGCYPYKGGLYRILYGGTDCKCQSSP